MKFYCLGYYDVEKWDAMSESERNDLIDECFAYDDVLRRNGHVAAGWASGPSGYPDHKMEKRQGRCFHRSIRKDEGATGGHPCVGSP